MPLPLPNYRDIVDLIKKGATIEAQEKIMELREAALTLQEENFGLRERVKKLDTELAMQKSVRFARRVYFVEGDPLPHCPYCYDAEKRLIHLTSPVPAALGGGLLLQCPHCGSVFKTQGDDSDFIFNRVPRRERH